MFAHMSHILVESYSTILRRLKNTILLYYIFSHIPQFTNPMLAHNVMAPLAGTGGAPVRLGRLQTLAALLLVAALAGMGASRRTRPPYLTKASKQVAKAVVRTIDSDQDTGTPRWHPRGGTKYAGISWYNVILLTKSTLATAHGGGAIVTKLGACMGTYNTRRATAFDPESSSYGCNTGITTSFRTGGKAHAVPRTRH